MSVVAGEPKRHANTSYKATTFTFLISDYYQFNYSLRCGLRLRGGSCSVKKLYWSYDHVFLTVNEPRCLLHKADHTIIQSMLIVSNHSVFNVLFLWGSSTYNPQINNGGQDSLTIKHFSSAIFDTRKQTKPAEGTKDCTKLNKRNDSSSLLAKTKIAT